VRTFIDAGQSLYPLLTSISRSASVPMKSYCSQLLTSFPPGSQPALAPRSGLIEPLTTREMELLGLIAQGMSNEEIASQLFISVGTVKAHTSNIYRKLDVRGRTQAVAKARELNLLT
jgi:LuxR family maltose regulon positive regulatory protein